MKSFNGTKCFYSDILFQCLQSKLNLVVHSVIFTFLSVSTVAKLATFTVGHRHWLWIVLV